MNTTKHILQSEDEPLAAGKCENTDACSHNNDSDHTTDEPSKESGMLNDSNDRCNGGQIDVEKSATTTVTKDSDTENVNVVWWDGPDDPMNPLNWSSLRKAANVGIVSAICLITPLASCKSLRPVLPQYSLTCL